MCVNDFIYRRRAIAAVGLILLAFTSRGVCVCGRRVWWVVGGF